MDIEHQNGDNMLDPSYLADLETRIIERTKQEWVGPHVTNTRVFLAPPVREGGATEALINLTAKVAVAEFSKL